ncbi:MAG: hypothetical protein E7626_00595 [Ruminococcaceae bacterium]|nr:hypothetical protein [Oscillospiraceae bacterium]
MEASKIKFRNIVIALVFLMNPCINIIDILPDFVAYLIIMRTLYAGAALYPHFRDSYTAFRNLTIISIAKTLSLPIIFIVSSTEMTWLLILAFAFGGLEIFYGVIAFSKLFEGIYYSAERTAGSKVFEGYDRARVFTVVFSIFRPVAAFFPELTLLSGGEYGTVTETGVISYADLRIPLTIFMIIFSLAVGIFWFVCAKKYFKALFSDNEYISAIREKYARFSVESPHLIDRRVVLSAVSLFAVGAILALELKLDGVNYIPNFAAAVLFIAAFSRLKAIYPKLSLYGIAASSLYALTSAVSWGFSVFFTAKYIVINKNQIGMQIGYGQQVASYLGTSAQVSRDFDVLRILLALEGLAFIIVLFFVTRALKEALLRHGGKYIYELGQVHDRKVLLRSTVGERVLVLLTLALGILSAILSVLQMALVATDYNLWIYDVLLRIAWVVLFIHTSDKIHESAKEKYIFIKSEGIE